MAVDGFNHAHVVWYRDYETNDHLYYKSFDGTIWSDLVALESVRFVYDPTITVDNRNRIHVAWSDWRYGHEWDYEIFYRRFNGLSWDPVERITEAPGNSRSPSVATDDSGNVYLAWMDQFPGVSQIYYARNDGTGWTTGVRLTNTGESARDPSMAVRPDGTVHIVWRDRRDDNWEVYYKRRGAPEYAGLEAAAIGAPGLRGLTVSPNPVSSDMVAGFSLAQTAVVQVTLFDIRGRVVSEVDLGTLPPGDSQFRWNVTGDSGAFLAPGIYFISINAGSCTRSAKIVVMR